MIKDVFKFKKKSWHARLMKFVWGYDPKDFRNMCPYFWLSVVNVICLPLLLVIMVFILLGKGIVKLTQLSQASVDRACDTRIMKWAAKKTENWWKDDDLIMVVGKYIEPDSYGNDGFYFYGDEKARKYREFFNALSAEDKKKLWDRYDARLAEIKAEAAKAQREQWDRQQHEAEKKRLRDSSRAVRIGKATVVIKTVFKILVWPILAFIGYLFFLLIVSATKWDYSWIPGMFYCLYVVFGTLLGLGLLVYSILVFSRWMNCKLQGVCIPCEERRRKIARGFKFCFSWLRFFGVVRWPFIWVGRFFRSIWRGIVFLWDIMIAFKQNNCPAIEWED